MVAENSSIRQSVNSTIHAGPVFLLIYFVSGAAALLYEVAWLRLMTLSIGHTAAAAGTVLAAFMGGLGLGAWIGGRVAERSARERALRIYAWLEVAIGVCALLVPIALSMLEPILAWAYRDGAGGNLFTLTRVGLCFLLLSVPATAMGATFPLAVRWFAARPVAATSRAGAIYAANTIGATAGAALTGFVLLPMLGLRGTTFVGVALNIVVAAGALLMARGASDSADHDRLRVKLRRSAVALAEAEGPRRIEQSSGTVAGLDSTHAARTFTCPAEAAERRRRMVREAAIALGLSGFVALIYEVTWTRILAMVLGPTTYAFSAVLVAFIAGLAIGSAVATALVPRIRNAGAWLALSLVFASVAALLASAVVDRLPLVMAAAASQPDATFASVFGGHVVLVVALQVPMAIGLGAAFPFAIALAGNDGSDIARVSAAVYASNTVGAIAGTVVGTFLLVPAFGIQASIRIGAGLAIVTGAVVWWRNTGFSRTIRLRRSAASAGQVKVRAASSRGWVRAASGIVATAALALAVVMPSWNHELLANGGYRYATSLAAGDLETGLEAGRLLYYREGAVGTVSVRELPGAISLAIDGKVDASNAGDMLTQKLLAHVPLLIHPNPQEVLIIGLGSGVTLGAALSHPIVRADVVEISPEVVTASEFFVRDNNRALSNPRSRLILGDGRSHLMLSRERYDVIVSEPSNPWMAGVASLFTREFFAAARDRLAPDGILCQWAHTYNISDRDLRSIVATFLGVFPDGTAWLVGASDLLLIGSNGSLEGFERRFGDALKRPGVAADLAEVSVRDAFSLISLFVAQSADLQRYADEAPVLSDDRLSLEYSAPRALYGRFQESNLDRLRQLARDARKPPVVADTLARATAPEWRNRGLMNLRAEAPALAYEDFREALARDGSDDEALEGFGRAAAAAGRLGDAEAFLREQASSKPNPGVSVELSLVLSALERLDEASAAARRAALLDPQNRAALQQLAAVYADQRDAGALERLARIVERSPAHRAVYLYSQARLSALRGDLEAAAQHVDQLVALDGRNIDALNLAGALHAALGHHDPAKRALDASLRIEPRNPVVLVNLGRLALQSNDPTTASDRFGEALFLRPTMPSALEGLAQAFERQGRHARAARIRALIPAS